MSMRSISIRNKLEVLPGNVIMIPGCEPTSAFTSPSLDQNRTCTASVITLERAKELIPEASIVMMRHPYKLYFVLPDGPPTAPGCPCSAQTDWYDILKEGAETVEAPSVNNADPNECDAFPLNRCGVF